MPTGARAKPHAPDHGDLAGGWDGNNRRADRKALAVAEQRRQGPNHRSGRGILPPGPGRPAAPPRAGRFWNGCTKASRCEPAAARSSHRLAAETGAARQTVAVTEQIRRADTEPEADMLAEHTPVQIRRSGAMVPVQSLRAGDVLYDPLSDDHVEILGIFGCCSLEAQGLLFGVAQGRLGPGCPTHGLALSRRRPILVPGAPEGNEDQPRLGPPTAQRIGIPLPEDAMLFAIFPERDRFMMSCGFCLRVLAPCPSHLH